MRLWSVSLDGTDLRAVDIPARSECPIADHMFPIALADGRVAYQHACRGGVSATFNLEAFDVSSTKREVLAVLPVPVSNFTWDVRRDAGFFGRSTYLCSGIARATSDGIEPLPTEVGYGNRRFRIDEDLRHDGATSCRDYGLADWPALSPDGERVAFFASPQSVGVAGFSKPEFPWNLYVMDSRDLEPEVLLTGIRFPQSPAWSPDGSYLVYSGVMKEVGGVWIVNTSSGVTRNLSPEEMDWLAWSPDGTSIAALHPVESERGGRTKEIVVLDVSAVI